ncbi:MAG: hypothetical protein K2K54_10125 [Lachnospiraceae bacterium]|nr:hypothetical protein [Lachnospiraceae bacterium]
MSKPMYQVVGIKKAVSTKTKKVCWTIYFAGDFTPYEMENCDCDGKSTFNEFTYTDFGLYVNDLVELDYAKGFQDKATLSGITVIRSPYLENLKAKEAAGQKAAGGK